MRLTDHTDYAFRVLLYLGTERDRLVTVGEIALVHAISHNHLTKVVHELGRGGLLATTRGRGGGVRLAIEPEAISLGAVARLMEPDFLMVECFDDDHNTCALAPHCALKHALGRAAGAFLRELDQTTLASVLPPAPPSPPGRPAWTIFS